MMNLIFKPRSSFDTSPNALLTINDDYVSSGSSCVFGDFSKTNVFIGENNSGKSRFLRYLFETNYYSMTKEKFDQLFFATKSDVYRNYDNIPNSNIECFNNIYKKIGGEYSPYSNVGNRFFNCYKDVQS